MHLGRRTVKTDGLHIKERYGCSNVDWFRQTYPEDKWINFVTASMKAAKNQVKEKMKASSNLKQAAASIEQTLNAEVAQAKFFGVDAGEIEQKKQVYQTVLEALRTTRVSLESECVGQRCSLILHIVWFQNIVLVATIIRILLNQIQIDLSWLRKFQLQQEIFLLS